jgi:hypothetical protein
MFPLGFSPRSIPSSCQSQVKSYITRLECEKADIENTLKEADGEADAVRRRMSVDKEKLEVRVDEQARKLLLLEDELVTRTTELEELQTASRESIGTAQVATKEMQADRQRRLMSKKETQKLAIALEQEQLMMREVGAVDPQCNLWSCRSTVQLLLQIDTPCSSAGAACCAACNRAGSSFNKSSA